METYCVRCKKNTANTISSVTKTKQNRVMLLSNCTIGDKKKSAFIKNEVIDSISNDYFKMNRIIKTGKIYF